MNKNYYYDEKSDSLFIYLKDGKEENFEEIAPGINIELDKNNEIIGVEILRASRFLKTRIKKCQQNTKSPPDKAVAGKVVGFEKFIFPKTAFLN